MEKNNTPKKIGYARVSTDNQELGRQIKALEDYGCDVIYQEKISGGKTKRPELDKMLQELKEGDTLVIHKLDRLGRSMMHLLQILQLLNEKKIAFISLGDSFDMSTPQGRLMFHMLGAFAEFERALIKERVEHGLKFAASQGRKGGRKVRTNHADIRMMLKQGLRPTDIAKSEGVSRQLVYDVKKSMELNQQRLEPSVV